MPIDATILRRYPNATFIETGTHVGDGVQAALDAGFENIVSCDLENQQNAIACHRFADNSRVALRIMDSRALLTTLLPFLAHPATFWLDAHACGTGGSYDDVPLLGELATIATHSIKTHTILIDDMRLVGSQHLRLDPSPENVSMWKLQDALRAINVNYQLRLIHSPTFCFDILAATP